MTTPAPLTPEDIRWLNQQGGRTEKDVLYDEHGRYVTMYRGLGGGLEKIYF